MANLDELSSILFNGTRENTIPDIIGAQSTVIIYGTALADSADGEVLVQLDDAIYAADEFNEDEYEIVELSDSNDDVRGIEEDDELIDIDDDEEELVYWEADDDDAVEED